MAETGSRARRNVVGRALRIGAPVLGVGRELERQHRLGRTVRAFGIVGAVLLIGTAGFYVLPEETPEPEEVPEDPSANPAADPLVNPSSGDPIEVVAPDTPYHPTKAPTKAP